MPKRYPEHINLGVTLIRRLCHYADVDDWQNMTGDDKQRIIELVSLQTNEECELTEKSLTRIIKEISSNAVKEGFSKNRPTYHTLCFVVCKCKKPSILLKTRWWGPIKHATPIYATHFIHTFIDPVLALGDKSNLPQAPATFINTKWYVYMSLFFEGDKKEIRKTGRRILTFTNEEDHIEAQYFVLDNVIPEWKGMARHDIADGHVYLNLHTDMIDYKDLTIRLRVGVKGLTPILYGFMTHTKADTIYDHVLVLKLLEPSASPFPRVTFEGEDKSISDIEAFLRENQKTVFRHKIPVQECGSIINIQTPKKNSNSKKIVTESEGTQNNKKRPTVKREQGKKKSAVKPKTKKSRRA